MESLRSTTVKRKFFLTLQRAIANRRVWILCVGLVRVHYRSKLEGNKNMMMSSDTIITVVSKQVFLNRWRGPILTESVSFSRKQNSKVFPNGKCPTSVPPKWPAGKEFRRHSQRAGSCWRETDERKSSGWVAWQRPYHSISSTPFQAQCVHRYCGNFWRRWPIPHRSAVATDGEEVIPGTTQCPISTLRLSPRNTNLLPFRSASSHEDASSPLKRKASQPCWRWGSVEDQWVSFSAMSNYLRFWCG